MQVTGTGSDPRDTPGPARASTGPTFTGRLVSTGSVIVDLPLAMPRLPERGGDMLGSAGARTPGGGFNVVVAAARAGARVALASPVGTGENGELCRAALAAEGVEVLTAADGDTGLCVTIVEPDGERTFLTAPGAEAVQTSQALARCVVGPGDVAYVSGYDLAYPDAGQAVAAWAADLPAGAVLVLDPGPLVGEIPPDLLTAVLVRCDVLSLNEREATILAGGSDDANLPEASDGESGFPGTAGGGGELDVPVPPSAGTSDANAFEGENGALDTSDDGAAPPEAGPEDGGREPAGADPDGGGDDRASVDPVATWAPVLRELIARFDAVVVLRLGEWGCVVAEPDRAPVWLPAPRVECRDSTGAGDAHVGAFAAALLRGADVVAAARYANAAAALSVTRPGPATSPTRAETTAFLASPGPSSPGRRPAT